MGACADEEVAPTGQGDCEGSHLRTSSVQSMSVIRSFRSLNSFAMRPTTCTLEEGGGASECGARGASVLGRARPLPERRLQARGGGCGGARSHASTLAPALRLAPPSAICWILPPTPLTLERRCTAAANSGDTLALLMVILRYPQMPAMQHRTRKTKPAPAPIPAAVAKSMPSPPSATVVHWSARPPLPVYSHPGGAGGGGGFGGGGGSGNGGDSGGFGGEGGALGGEGGGDGGSGGPGGEGGEAGGAGGVGGIGGGAMGGDVTQTLFQLHLSGWLQNVCFSSPSIPFGSDGV